MYFVLIVLYICAIGTLAAELWNAIREKNVYAKLGQPIEGASRERRLLIRLLLLLSISSLLFALTQSSARIRWSPARVGLAIVIESSLNASMAKSAAKDMVRQLPGLTCSLYELKGDALTNVVPPTIDKIFFELLLDDIRDDTLSKPTKSLEEIGRIVRHTSPDAPPWVLVLSSSRPSRFDWGASVLSTQDPNLSKQLLHVRDLVAASTAEMVRPSATDGTESLVTALALIMAWLCFLLWRRETVPVAFLDHGGLLLATMVVLCTPSAAWAVDRSEANFAAKTARELADGGNLAESQRRMEALLVETSDALARGRLAYNIALLSYLQGHTQEAWHWLQTEEPEGPKSEVLRGFVLIRLAAESFGQPDHAAAEQRLAQWLATKPAVPRGLVDLAEETVRYPSLYFGREAQVLRTLCWLECHGGDWRAVPSITASTNGAVQRRLAESWSEDVANRFLEESTVADGPLCLFRSRLWYDFAAVHSRSDGIALLLAEAAAAANRSLFFPQLGAICSDELAYVTDLLDDVAPLLPESWRRSLLWIVGRSRTASEWYMFSTVWPVLQSLTPAEIDSLASVSSGIADRAMALWFARDPEQASDFLIGELDSSPSFWTPVLTQLIDSSEQAAEFSRRTGGSLSSFDPALVGYLWQISSVDTSLPQKIDHLLKLFRGLERQIRAPDDTALRSLCLIFSMREWLFDDLKKLRTANADSDILYFQLLTQWNDECLTVSAAIQSPETFRLQTVARSISRAAQIILSIQTLLERPVVSEVQAPGATEEHRVAPSVRKENAVRLFQEMDRSDRELYQS